MKPTLPKGTRDFSPLEMSRRNYIFDTIRAVFRTYGYQQIETPAMENLSTLTGKYGDEGDKLIFKILNSGDVFNKKNLFEYIRKYKIDELNNVLDELYEEKEYKNIEETVINDLAPVVADEVIAIYDNPDFSTEDKKILMKNHINSFPHSKRYKDLLAERIIGSISLDERIAENLVVELKANSTEKALRYDLTVPFARYVVMNRNDITFPFKRYQVQPVWRADRPQKGRYREFYQFDADVVGSPSLVYEAEFFQIFAKVFEKLGAKVTIKYNNRKVLNGIVEAIGAPDKFTDIITAIDKLDKIGDEGVEIELRKIGLSDEQIKKAFIILNMKILSNLNPHIVVNSMGGHDDMLFDRLTETLETSNIGLKGIEELRSIVSLLKETDSFDFSTIEFDPSLARGLSYYTGAIFEVKAHGVQIGSICGGGRYDDLTGLFGLPNVSGVGISFGVDRIYDVLNELNLFPETLADAAKVLVTNFGVEEEKYSFNLVTKLRAAGINADMYPTQAKLGKQFEYADKKKIPFVAVVGADEMANNVVNLKDMVSGVQEKFTVEELIEKLK